MELYIHSGMSVRRAKCRAGVRIGSRMMELYLQFGYGMMQHCRHLIEAWGGGTVILSPRDLSEKQLKSLSKEIRQIEHGHVLLDPQFYLPHADHERLCSHAYWPQDYDTGAFFEGGPLRELLNRLLQLSADLGTTDIVLPGLLATRVDDVWIGAQYSILEAAKEVCGDRFAYMTIALGADTARDQEQIATLIESASDWEADGYYIVCEHPNGDYLVQDPNWLANVLDLTTGLRLTGAKVVLGYCNHQMLAAGVVGANAIASGTWMNVRSFPPDKFRSSLDDEIKQRSTWYYCPKAFSEYKIPFLDVAQRQKLLMRMAPQPELDGGYSRHLFEGPQPTTVGFSEQLAFRHYLHALKGQIKNLALESYDEALAYQYASLDDAEDILGVLVAAGIRGQKRDFTEIIDVNRAALSLIDSTRGPVLRRRWSELV